MTKIVLLCSAGMSTSMLVNEMKKAAEAQSLECSIAAYSISEANEKASDADVILLGPQVRFFKSKVAEQLPGIPMDVIDAKIYGRMDGKGALKKALELIG